MERSGRDKAKVEELADSIALQYPSLLQIPAVRTVIALQLRRPSESYLFVEGTWKLDLSNFLHTAYRGETGGVRDATSKSYTGSLNRDAAANY